MKRENSSARRPSVWMVAAFAVLALLAVLGVKHFVAQPFNVPSGSMEPTLHPGEMILVDRATRGMAKRGDVVVFDGTGFFAPSGAEGSGFWVKRVVGVGGDRVTCCNSAGQITVNGVPLGEPYLARGSAPSAVEFDVEVPRGRIFVLGDNRAHSSDSRDHLGDPGGGMIPEERVAGRAVRVIWPLKDWRSLDQ